MIYQSLIPRLGENCAVEAGISTILSVCELHPSGAARVDELDVAGSDVVALALDGRHPRTQAT